MREERKLRLRERFLNDNLDNFADHEVLELLLSFVIPKNGKDPNEIAHNLIFHFASLSGVFKAEPYELAEVEGMNKSACVLVSMIPCLLEKYKDDLNREKTLLDTGIKVKEYLSNKIARLPEEEFHVLCLDHSLHLIKDVLISKGSVDKIGVDLKIINKHITKHRATNIILAHNHPSGSVMPSYNDDIVTKMIIKAFSIFDIRVLDHLIVSNNECFSYCREGLMDEFNEINERFTEEELLSQTNAPFHYDE